MKLLFRLLITMLFLQAFTFITRAEETLIIFDASISMNDDFYGKAKYVAAADEAKKVLSTFNSNRTVGLRTIGIKLDASALNYIQNPSLMCKATQLEVPIRQNTAPYINSALNSVIPLGTTPLEYTLRTSVQSDFTKGNHLKHIILITDGGENCNGDPCKYIRELMATRKDIKIDIIAISVNGDDFKQLKCLTDYTNGTIVNVKNPSDLSVAFNTTLKESANVSQNYNASPSYNNVYSNNISPASGVIKYKNYVFETYE